MKTILIIMSILFGQCSSQEKEANEKHITLCKASGNLLLIDYLDSSKGISKITQRVENDTLTLNVYVSVGKEQKGHEIEFDASIKFVSTGELMYEINKIGNCGDIKSGKAALDKF